jgi:hypothetical protein
LRKCAVLPWVGHCVPPVVESAVWGLFQGTGNGLLRSSAMKPITPGVLRTT